MPPGGGTTTTIRIILSSNAKDFGRDLDGLGNKGRGAGKGLGELGDAAGKSGKNIVSLGGLVREAAASFGGFLSAQAVFAGISKAVGFVKDTILGFNSAMTESVAIMGTVSANTRKDMEMTARDVAVKYNASVADVANTYYYLASAGYDAATSQKAVGQVVAFAKAGMFDLETATSLAADAQNAMGLKSSDSSENLVQLTRITDVLTKANIDANGSVQDFAKALTNKAAAGARLAGVSLESTVAVLEAFAAQGLKGKRAGEAFAIVLRDLQNRAQEDGEAFEKLGITVFDAQGNFTGFPKIIGQMEKALAGMSVEQVNATLNTLGFTMEAGAYVKTLLGMSGAIGDYEGKLKSAGGATQAIAEKQMTSMIERLNHMRVVAAEVGLKGFDLLTQAAMWMAEQLAPAIEDGAVALERLVTWARPAGELLLKVAGGAVVGGFLALAAALRTSTGFLRDHETVLQAIAVGGLAYLVAVLGTAAAGWIAFGTAYASTFAVLLAYDIARWAISVYVAMSRAALSSGLLGAGITGLKAVMSSTAVQAGLFSAALFGLMQAYQQSHEAATKWVEGMTQRIDPTNIHTVRQSLKQLNEENDKLVQQIQGENWLGQYAAGMVDLIVPIHDVEDSVYDLGNKSDAAQDKISELRKQTEEASSTFTAMAKSLSPANQALQEGAGKWSMFNQEAQKLAQAKAGLEVDRISQSLATLALRANIDITRPVAEWRDELQKAWVASQNTLPAMEQLSQAFATVADESSSAEDAVDAYKKALDALVGIHVSSKEAEIGFAGSLDTVREKVGAGINLLDVYNARNREGASAVLAAADAAIEHSVAIYGETGSLDKANATLGQHREQLINSMVQTGMTRQAAEAYLNTLGLTPKNIETLAKLNKDQASQGASELQAQLEATARQRTVVITADISGAEASLARFGVKLNDLERRAIASMQNYDSGMRPHADGAVYVAAYAAGGMRREDHTAQISPRGVMRLWGEPETGGEAYIPLAAAKRARSMRLLDRVAEMFGYELVKPFAQGGTYGLNDAAFELAAATWGQRQIYEDLSFEGMSAGYAKWLSEDTNGQWNRKQLVPEYGSSGVSKYGFDHGNWSNGALGARMQQILAPAMAAQAAEQEQVRAALFAIHDAQVAQQAGYVQSGMQRGAGGQGAHRGVFVGPGAVVVHANGAGAGEVQQAVQRAFVQWQKDMRREMRVRRAG